MRIPTRHGEQLKQQADDSQTTGPLFMTPDGVKHMQDRLKRLEEIELPQAIQDTRTTAEFGDFSENAEYQEAKARMRRLHAQIFHLKEKLKQVLVISQNAKADLVQLGSTVVLETDGKKKTYEIVGPQETNPARGRISHLSPLGVALIGRRASDSVTLEANGNPSIFTILEIK